MIEKLLYDPNRWDCHKQSIKMASKEEIVIKINEIIDYINEYPIITTPKKTADYTITRTEVDND